MKTADLMLLSKVSPEAIVERALCILEERARYNVVRLDSPTSVKDFLRLKIGASEREEFWCVWLDAQNQVIDMECMFVGTVNQTSVYPREVVKRALQHNASAVIFAHNHPSGATEPSTADECLTRVLKQALDLVDVRTLDHFIVTAASTLSFAERGLL